MNLKRKTFSLLAAASVAAAALAAGIAFAGSASASAASSYVEVCNFSGGFTVDGWEVGKGLVIKQPPNPNVCAYMPVFDNQELYLYVDGGALIAIVNLQPYSPLQINVSGTAQHPAIADGYPAAFH